MPRTLRSKGGARRRPLSVALYPILAIIGLLSSFSHELFRILTVGVLSAVNMYCLPLLLVRSSLLFFSFGLLAMFLSAGYT